MEIKWSYARESDYIANEFIIFKMGGAWDKPFLCHVPIAPIDAPIGPHNIFEAWNMAVKKVNKPEHHHKFY